MCVVEFEPRKNYKEWKLAEAYLRESGYDQHSKFMTATRRQAEKDGTASELTFEKLIDAMHSAGIHTEEIEDVIYNWEFSAILGAEMSDHENQLSVIAAQEKLERECRT